MVSGGRDVGMVAVVRTMTCKDCDELVDVLIGRYGENGPTGDPDYDDDLDVCPNCKGRNVQLWSSSHSCPRCGCEMKRERGMAIQWD